MTIFLFEPEFLLRLERKLLSNSCMLRREVSSLPAAFIKWCYHSPLVYNVPVVRAGLTGSRVWTLAVESQTPV